MDSTTQTHAKRMAAEAAVAQYVKEGMILGLGSGSTALLMLEALARRVGEGLEIKGVPTSRETAQRAEALGIPLLSAEAPLPPLALTLDGTDEIDPRFRLIKGGGGCLVREKIIAQASAEMVIMADETKGVARLGAFPLPIEVIPFAWQQTQRQIEALADQHRWPLAQLLRRGEAEPFISDNGNYILDAHFGQILDPEALAAGLLQIAGVLESGLFLGLASAAVVGKADGTVAVLSPGGAKTL